MHPAGSIVFFTVFAGAGYGLLFLFGLAAPLGLLPIDRWLGFVGLGLALGLLSLGLAASAFHLGHPERAWRALTQWRSSWLSREGVVALLTYVPAGLFFIGWVILQDIAGTWTIFALLSALGAVITVYCTSMIYGSLKTIRQWHHPMVAPLYLLFALMTGAFAFNAVLMIFGQAAPWSGALALVSLALAWGVKWRYWQSIDSGKAASTPESATGLGSWGKVRLLEAPHSEENYLMREMGFTIARKHATKLRRVALIVGAGGAAVLTLVALLTTGWIAILAAIAAAVAAFLGTLLERWLFFAEATHTVMLYYGRDAA